MNRLYGFAISISLAFIAIGFMALQSGPSNANGPSAVTPWTHSFDLDGDGQDDIIEVEYTGGAHCCYRLKVHLSSNRDTHKLPFQLDGGYIGGLDLSRPERFDIRITDGRLPELVMEIETYNGEPQPIPADWTQRFSITTHRIAVGFSGGALRVRDWPPQGAN